MSRPEHALVVCEHCGQGHRWSPLAPGAIARCQRCEAVLGRGHRMTLGSVLALTLTAAVALATAISTDVLTISMRGSTEAATLPQAVAAVWGDGQPILATVTALTAIVAPALFVALRLYVLVPLAAGRIPRGFAFCVRALHHAGRWNLTQVFTIGALLSLVRLAALADAAPGPGLYALGAMTLLVAAIESAGLKHLWWAVR